jgi:hypothetical protein
MLNRLLSAIEFLELLVMAYFEFCPGMGMTSAENKLSHGSGGRKWQLLRDISLISSQISTTCEKVTRTKSLRKRLAGATGKKKSRNRERYGDRDCGDQHVRDRSRAVGHLAYKTKSCRPE